MSDGLVAVRLYGALADQFAAEHRFAIRSPVEAISALEANHPGFRKAFVQYRRYYVRADGDWRTNEAATFPVSREIDIVPAVEGDSFVVPALAGVLASSLGIGATTATILSGVLVLGLLVGVSLLLSPKPKKDTSDKDKKESNAFSGPDNIVGQGAAVPLVYGHCLVGSVVIAIGIETSDQAIPGVGSGGGGKGK